MPAQKRRAPATPEAPLSSSSRRRSTRISSTGKKSQYFEGGNDSDTTEEDELSTPQSTNDVKNKNKKAKITKNGRPRGRPAKKAAESEDDTAHAKKEEEDGDDDQEYDDDNDDLDEDEKPRVTFTPHVKMRDTGGVPYQDDRLHKNTLLFLKDLKANNKRTWLKCKLKGEEIKTRESQKLHASEPLEDSDGGANLSPWLANDEEYRRSLTDWNTYVETIQERIINIDPTIPELPLKDIIFRM